MLYEHGLLVGRFQMFHKGHEHLIKSALLLCTTVVIMIGSAQESGTVKNPFPYEIRKQAIEKVFPVEIHEGRIIILPLNDIGVGDNSTWGEYVLKEYRRQIAEHFKRLVICKPEEPEIEPENVPDPCIYITGCEKARASWFTNEMAPNMDELRLSRATYELSGTSCREALLKDREAWEKMVPEKLHGDYLFYNLIYKNITNMEEK